MTTKTCIKCGEEKDISEFYKYARNRDGYRHECKECGNKERALANKLNPQWNKAAHKNYHERHKDDPIYLYKKMARKLAQAALLLGDIEEPACCPICGVIEKLEMHHEDYTDPLNVQWMCHTCHRKVDKDE